MGRFIHDFSHEDTPVSRLRIMFTPLVPLMAGLQDDTLQAKAWSGTIENRTGGLSWLLAEWFSF